MKFAQKASLSVLAILAFSGLSSTSVWAWGGPCLDDSQCSPSESCFMGTCYGYPSGIGTGSPSDKGCQAVIAYSATTGNYGQASGVSATSVEQEKTAIANCNRGQLTSSTDCQVAVTTSNGCAAIARDSKSPASEFGVGAGVTLGEAWRHSMESCTGSSCSLLTWVCCF